MGGGLLVGLSNEDAARFSFLLATPIIGAAALLKLPELFGSEGDGVRGPALVASLCAALTAFFGSLATSGLPKPYHPMFNLRQFERASQDRFFLCIEARDAAFDSSRTREFLQTLAPLQIAEVPK